MNDKQKEKLKEILSEIVKEEDLGFGEISIRIQDFKPTFIELKKQERI